MENSVSLRALHKFWAGRGAFLLLLTLLLGGFSCAELSPPAAVDAPSQAPDQAPRLKILISNDDGIEAPGLIALAREMSKFAAVTVAAPAQNASGVSHGKTSGDPIFVTESVADGVRWFSIKATPASCVRLALESLILEKPDFVLSGINKGENLGLITFYSATLGSAREAAFSGITSVALNLESGPTMDYAMAAEFAAALVRELANNPIKVGLFVNVNIPNLLKDKIKGTLIVPVDPQPPYERFEKRISPDGKAYFWSTYRPLVAGSEITDVWAPRLRQVSPGRLGPLPRRDREA